MCTRNIEIWLRFGGYSMIITTWARVLPQFNNDENYICRELEDPQKHHDKSKIRIVGGDKVLLEESMSVNHQVLSHISIVIALYEKPDQVSDDMATQIINLYTQKVLLRYCNKDEIAYIIVEHRDTERWHCHLIICSENIKTHEYLNLNPLFMHFNLRESFCRQFECYFNLIPSKQRCLTEIHKIEKINEAIAIHKNMTDLRKYKSYQIYKIIESKYKEGCITNNADIINILKENNVQVMSYIRTGMIVKFEINGVEVVTKFKGLAFKKNFTQDNFIRDSEVRPETNEKLSFYENRTEKYFDNISKKYQLNSPDNITNQDKLMISEINGQ